MYEQLTPRQQSEAAVRTFGRWFAADHLRERYAQAHRGALLKRLQAGESAIGYRADFIADTARQIQKVLQEAKGRFDAAHPWDKCMPPDLVDILATTGGLVQNEDDEIDAVTLEVAD